MELRYALQLLRREPSELESSFPDLRAYYFLRTQYEDAMSRFSAGRRMKTGR